MSSKEPLPRPPELTGIALHDINEWAEKIERDGNHGPWYASHGALSTGGKNGKLLADCYVNLLGGYFSKLWPQRIRELVRGYIVYRYLRAQHPDLVDTCERTIVGGKNAR